MSTNVDATYSDAVPDADVGAVAEHRPVEELAGPEREGDEPERDREAERGAGDALPAARLPHEVGDGQQRRCAGLLGERRDRDRDARGPRLRRGAARSTAAVIAGSMNTSKLAAWPSWGANATIAKTQRSPAIHPARRPHRRRASQASSQAVNAMASIATRRTVHSAVEPKNSNDAA